jgi:type VI secretion system secreted protein VgrG
VAHVGINNMPKGLSAQLAGLKGDLTGDLTNNAAHNVLPTWVGPALRRQAAKSGYANTFAAHRVGIPWHPAWWAMGGATLGTDAEDELRPLLPAVHLPAHSAPHAPLHPKARHAGLRTATVVDAQGSPEPRDAAVHGDALGRIRVRFDEQGRLPAADGHALSSIWVRVAQVWASSGVGGSVGAQFMPRLGQQVLVDFINGDLEQPVVVGAVYDGRGEGALAATPGGEAGEVDRSVFGMSGDHRPSAQGNLVGGPVGGHSPAWHGASPEGLDQQGQRNAAALSGFKSQEWDGGSGFSQLVLDDSDSQLRVQLATTAHSSQLNLGHLIHQADNHRGSFRGTGFELRTDAYASLRAGHGLLLSTAPSRAQEPAGDNAAGLALGKQLQQLASTFSQAAGTHKVPTLAAALGSAKANASAQSDTEAPAQALLTALKGLVDGKALDGALSDAAARNVAGNKLPHTVSPVVALQAQGGLIEVAGQDHVQAAGHTVLEAAGQALDQAVGGDWRLHTGQAIGLLGGVIKPGSGSAGTGLTAIAASKEVQVQAQSDTLTLAAQKDVTAGSQSAHVDWAAAKSITLAVSGGASITIEGGRIEVKAPGTITVKAGKKSLVGASTYAMDMNLPKVKAKYDEELVLLWPFDKKPVANRGFEIKRMDGSVVRGTTDKAGKTGLQKSDFFENLQLNLLPDD